MADLWSDKRKGRGFVVSPLYVANNLIITGRDTNASMTHLKLQKMVYMLYARFLAKHDASLFSNRFVAWQYGPVLTEIYDAFKKYGSRNIEEPRKNGDGLIMIVAEEGAFRGCFEEVWAKYERYSGSALVKVTHEEGSAWYKAVLRDNKMYGGFLDDKHIRDDGERWFSN